jgi:hypothetical protein
MMSPLMTELLFFWKPVIFVVCGIVGFCVYCDKKNERHRLDTQMWLNNTGSKTEIHNHFYGQVSGDQIQSMMRAPSIPLESKGIGLTAPVTLEPSSSVEEMTVNPVIIPSQQEIELSTVMNEKDLEDAIDLNALTKQVKASDSQQVDVSVDDNVNSLFASLAGQEEAEPVIETDSPNKLDRQGMANSYLIEEVPFTMPTVKNDPDNFWGMPEDTMQDFMTVTQLLDLKSLRQYVNDDKDLIFPAAGKIEGIHDNLSKPAVLLADPFNKCWVTVDKSVSALPKGTVLYLQIKVNPIGGENVTLSQVGNQFTILNKASHSKAVTQAV